MLLTSHFLVKITHGNFFVFFFLSRNGKKREHKTEIIINKTDEYTTVSLLSLCQFQDKKREEIFLLKDNKYHTLGL